MHVFATFAFLYCVAFAVAGKFLDDAFATCGQENSVAVQSAINSSVDRLMELRHPGWGWINTPEVVLGLQLSAQGKFFGRKKALDRMEDEIDDTIDSMNIGKLALYVMSVQASCKDPRDFGGRNLVDLLAKRIKRQFVHNDSPQTIPYDRYYRFGLALGALCVNSKNTETWVIRKLLKGQNGDGSFGSVHSADDAAQILLALTCVESQYTEGPFQRKIKKAAGKLAAFLRTKITTKGRNVWIGNKYSSPSSALALMNASDDSPQAWKCNSVMQSLVSSSISSGREGELSQRLPSLSGTSYLDLKSKWKCASPVYLPPDYKPTCNPKDPPTCGPAAATTISPAPLIEVRLTIYTEKPPAVGTAPNAEVVVSVNKGSTLLTAMKQAQDEEKITFETKTSPWGESITSMQGVVADAGAHEYWGLVNGATGKPLPQGASSYVPASGEQIVFRLKTW